MNEAPDNPPGNQLRPGAVDGDVAGAVSRSGYPLQLRVALELVQRFSVIEEWGYIDRETKEPRSLDLHAYLSTVQDPQSQFHPELVLLVECKRSELPFAFFAAAVPRLPREYPSLVGFGRRRFELHEGAREYREVTPTEFLALRELPFISKGPPESRAFAKAERSSKTLELSGEVPFRSVIMPLTSALHHWEGMRRADGDRQRYFPSLGLMVCVLDAPMILVSGKPNAPELVLQPWIRVVRQESIQDHTRISYRHYVVDFVHVDYLSVFLVDHVIPFARAVAARIEEAKSLINGGRATVKSWDNWLWSELLARSS